MKTAKEFLEYHALSDVIIEVYSENDCEYMSDLMEHFANARAKAVLEEAQNKLKEAGYTNAHEIIESLIPKEQ